MMYAFVYQREWIKQLCDAMQTEASHVDETRGPDKKKRPRIRKSFHMKSLPDERGRMIPMTNDHKMALVCFLTHIHDVEAKSSSCLVTVETVAEAVGCGNTKAEGIIKQLRAVGLIARKSRSATSTQTHLYRSPGCWAQQAIDEAPLEGQTAEPVKSFPRTEAPKSVEVGKAASKVVMDQQTEAWLADAEQRITKSELAEHPLIRIAAPQGRPDFDSKELADKAISLLKGCLAKGNRVARAAMEDDRWYIIALLRPEIIASLRLSAHYLREVIVDRLPKFTSVDDFGVSCTMLRLFNPDSNLHERYVHLFGPGLHNPAGQLVTHVRAIVIADVSISNGFPFSIAPPSTKASVKPAGTRGAQIRPSPCEVNEHEGRGESKAQYEQNCNKDDFDEETDDENSYDDDSYESDEDEDEPRYDSNGEMIARYAY